MLIGMVVMLSSSVQALCWNPLELFCIFGNAKPDVLPINETILDDGSVFRRINNTKIEILTETGTIYSISSLCNLKVVGNIKNTREWNCTQTDKNNDTITSNKELSIIRNAVCSDYITYNSGTLGETKKYIGCIVYTPEYTKRIGTIIDADTGKNKTGIIIESQLRFNRINKNTVKIAGYADPVIDNMSIGLAGCWPLDGNANDSSNNSNNGFEDGAVISDTVVKKLGSASYYFDGLNADIEIPDDATLRFGTGNFTISAWVRTNASGQVDDFPVMVSKGDTGGSEWMLRIRKSDNITNFYGGAGIANDFYSTKLTQETFHHIVVLRNSTGLASGDADQYYFIDGLGEMGDTSSNFSASTTKNIEFGTGDESSTRRWRGHIDEVAIWTRVLNGSELDELYNSGIGLTCGEIINGTAAPVAECSQASDINDGDINECVGKTIDFNVDMLGNYMNCNVAGKITIDAELSNWKGYKFSDGCGFQCAIGRRCLIST